MSANNHRRNADSSRSSKQVCDVSIAGTVGLSLTEGMDRRVLGSLCIVQVAASVTSWSLSDESVRACARVCK
jgi:hypothetical protein